MQRNVWIVRTIHDWRWGDPTEGRQLLNRETLTFSGSLIKDPKQTVGIENVASLEIC